MAAVIIVVMYLVAACTGATAHGGTTATGGALVTAAPPGKAVQITLLPAQPASPGVLAAAAQVLRRRAALLGLAPVRVTVSGQQLVLTGPQSSQARLTYLTAGGVLAFRPVLLFAPGGAASAAGTSPGSGPFGDRGMVSAAVMRLFGKLACGPGDGWKAAVGYTPAEGQYDDPASQIVSCDAGGSKYALGPAVFQGLDITRAATSLLPGSVQWVVTLTLDSQAARAFATLTTNQYNSEYLPWSSGGNSDANKQALDETGIVLDGDVQEAPVTEEPITGGQVQISGGTPGYTQDAAQDLAALLGGGQLPVSLRIGSVSAAGGAQSGSPVR